MQPLTDEDYLLRAPSTFESVSLGRSDDSSSNEPAVFQTTSNDELGSSIAAMVDAQGASTGFVVGAPGDSSGAGAVHVVSTVESGVSVGSRLSSFKVSQADIGTNFTRAGCDVIPIGFASIDSSLEDMLIGARSTAPLSGFQHLDASLLADDRLILVDIASNGSVTPIGQISRIDVLPDTVGNG